MTLLGLLLIARDTHVSADIDRFQIDRAIDLSANPNLEETVARCVKGCAVIVFASPRRRWSEVMEVMRTAAVKGGGELVLRFYQPTATVDVTLRFETLGWRICPLVREFESGQGSKAYALRKALVEGLMDIDAAHTRKVANHARALLNAMLPEPGSLG